MALFVASAFVGNAGAQTDVTSTYLKNADFSSTEGWTPYVSAKFRDYGNGVIGTYKAKNHTSTKDNTHLNTEFCLGLECRWSSNYASYTQETESKLPNGVYTLSFDVENTNPNTTSASYSNLFYVKIGETTIMDAKTEWMKNQTDWTSHSISFTITEPSKIIVSFGYGTGNNNYADANTPELYVSHLKLSYVDLLESYKTSLQTEIETAKGLSVAENEQDALASAITTAESVLSSATTGEELMAAAQTLRLAITTAKYGLSSATLESPVEIVGLISNPSFENGETGWEMTTTYTNWGANAIAGDEGKLNKQQWNGNFEVTQTLMNLPNGAYELTVQGFYRPGGNDATSTAQNAILYANDQVSPLILVSAGGKDVQDNTNGYTTLFTGVVPNVYVPNTQNDASKAFAANGYSVNSVRVVVTNNTLKIGAKKETAVGNDWTVIDNFRLYYMGSDAEKYQLKNTIESVADLNTTANVGDKPFQIPSSAVTTLVNAVKTANEALNAEDATAESYTEANTALEEAIAAYKNVELNAPAENTRYTLALNEPEYKYKGLAATFIKGGQSEAQGLYAIQYKSTMNKNYAQAFEFIPVESGTNLYYLKFTDNDGNNRYLCDGSITGASTGVYGIRTTIEPTSALPIKVIAADVDGVTYLWNTKANQYIGSNGDNGMYTDAKYKQFAIEAIEQAEVTLTVKETGWATLILPFNAEISDDITLYSCTEVSESNELVLVEAESIVANTPYIVKGVEGATKTYDFAGYGLATADTYTAGLLTGVYKQTTATANTYVLQNHDGEVAFYLVGEVLPEIGANRCFLTAQSATAPMFSLERGEGTTSIEDVELTNENVVIYDLAGRRVEKMEKGVYIVNGKKVIR